MKGLSCIMFQANPRNKKEDILSCSAQWLAVGSPFSCTRPAKKQPSVIFVQTISPTLLPELQVKET